MELKVTNKWMDTGPIRQRLTQGEALVDRPRIVLPRNYEGLDISGYGYEIRAMSEEDTLVRQPLRKLLEGNKVILIWEVTAEFTAVAGPLRLMVVGMNANGTEIIKITSEDILVRDDVKGEIYPPPPDLLEDALRQMGIMQNAVNAARQRAEEAAAAAKGSENQAVASAAAAKASQDNAAASAAAAGSSQNRAAESALKAEAAQNAIENMRVSAETLSPGSSATVDKTIENGLVHLAFGIPQGRQGDTGPQGAVGPKGEQGIPGPEGPRGIDGVAVSVEGTYAFNVNADGHLIVSYTGDTAPDFAINDDGHLILTI